MGGTITPGLPGGGGAMLGGSALPSGAAAGQPPATGASNTEAPSLPLRNIPQWCFDVKLDDDTVMRMREFCETAKKLHDGGGEEDPTFFGTNHHQIWVGTTRLLA